MGNPIQNSQCHPPRWFFRPLTPYMLSVLDGPGSILLLAIQGRRWCPHRMIFSCYLCSLGSLRCKSFTRMRQERGNPPPNRHRCPTTNGNSPGWRMRRRSECGRSGNHCWRWPGLRRRRHPRHRRGCPLHPCALPRFLMRPVGMRTASD